MSRHRKNKAYQFRNTPNQVQAALLGIEWPLVAGWRTRVDAMTITPELHAALMAARTPRQLWWASEKTRLSPAVRQLIWLLAAMRGEPLKGAVGNEKARNIYQLMQKRLGAPAPESPDEEVATLILRHLDTLTYRRLPCQSFSEELDNGARLLVQEIERYGRLLSPSELESQAAFETQLPTFANGPTAEDAEGSTRDTPFPEAPFAGVLAVASPPTQAESVPQAEPVRAPTVALAHQVALQRLRERCGQELRVQGEQTAIPEGFLYLVTHPQFKGWVKAGMTIDYEQRLATYNIADPLARFELAAVRWVSDRRASERQLLCRLANVAKESRGEWFKLSLSEASAVF